MINNINLQLNRDYHAWKGWSKLFVYSADQAGYYAGELRDVKILEASVLEIGFGTGSCMAWMGDQGANVVGTEIDENSCSAARAREIELLPADLPAAVRDHAARFDTILAFDVFEHLSLATASCYLAASAMLLRPGGKLVLRFPNAQSPFGLAGQYGDPTHCTPLSGQVIELLVIDLPLRVTRYSGSFLFLGRPFSLRWMKRSIRKVAQAIVGTALRFVYATEIPYDSVVVVVLERK